MTSKPFLRSLKVRGWRSFPTEGEVGQLDQLGQVNILAGPNNAGKSNYLRFLTWLRDLNPEVGEGLFPFGIKATQTWKLQNGPVKIWLSVDPESSKDFGKACAPFLNDSGLATFYLNANNTPHGYRCDGTILLSDGQPHLFTDKDGQRAFRPGKGQTLEKDASGRALRDATLNAVQPVRMLFQMLKERVFDLQPVRFDNTNQGHNIIISSNGTNTIHRWRELGNDAKRSRYLRIRRDLHRVLPRWLGVSKATIDLSLSDLKIEFSDSFSAPLIELGSGVTELVLQFLFILLQREELEPGIPFTMLIDEPESHLHPAIAYDFVKTVADVVPECQLIVTSHAPVLLDGLSSPHWRAYRVRMSDDGATHTSPILETSEKRLLAADIGLSASQLALASVVIWVEGPSDVFYIRRLLRDHKSHGAKGKLVEYRDYAFAIYGGSLLAHCAMSDPTKLVSFLSISQYCLVICDKDQAATGEPLKLRVQNILRDALRKHPDFSKVLVTPGREIENLVTSSVLYDAFERVLNTCNVLPSKRVPIPSRDSVFQSVAQSLHSKRPSDKVRIADEKKRLSNAKVDLAMHVSELPEDPFVEAAHRWAAKIAAYVDGCRR